MKKKRIIGTSLLVVLCMLSVWGCKSIKDSKGPKTLGELAYDENKQYGYTVYLKENSEYVPYLVLTADYNGQALLLREELLEESRVINEDNYGYAGYYKDSSMDRFLNEEFLTCLEPEIQEAIVYSEITITAKESLGITGTETENIVRKVFLLSYTELAHPSSSVVNKEGEPLKYFENTENRIAYRAGEPASWWLRSSETWEAYTTCAIDRKGVWGHMSVDKKCGVRPAFCLSNNLLIERSRDVLEGQGVYVVKKSQ